MYNRKSVYLIFENKIINYIPNPSCMKKVLYLFLLIAGLSSVANFAYSDTSGIITIYNPNAGVQWYAGNPYNITWYYDHTYHVKIDLLGPGATVTPLTGDTPNSSYTWTIPTGQTPGTYQIRITSVYNPATTTTSSAFTIAATDPNKIITIYRPVVGEQWVRGTSYPITWWDNITEGVDVHLYKSDHTYVGTIATNQLTNSTLWTVGDFAGGNPVPAGNYYIKLTSSLNSSIVVWSGLFSVIDNDPNLNITVYNPYVGEEWVKGASKNITWWDNITGNVDILLYLPDKTTSVGTIATNQSGAAKSWTVGNLGGPAVPDGFYYIKIVGHTVTGVSGWSGLFHIITTDPNSIITIYRPVVGEEWIRGTSYPITWWDNITEGVDIHLYRSDHTYLGTIATNQPGPTYSWTIGDHLGANPIPAGDYYIKLTSNINSEIVVWSGLFHIVTTNPNSIITIYRPVVGEEWVKGSTYPITWWDNITEGVDIHLYKSDHTYVGTIATNQPGPTYSWTIGNYLGSNPVPAGDYYIKLTSNINSAIVVWSGLFRIIKADQNLMFTLYNPYAGEEWVEGTTHNITWWDNFSENIKIELFTDAGVYVRPVVVSTPSNGTYAWTIPWHPDLLPFLVPGNYKLNFSRLTTNAMQTGADRLVQEQNTDGGWGWPLTGGSAMNTIAPIGKGLIQCYNRTLSATELAAINKTKTLLLTKTDNFSLADGYLAKALDDVLGGTTCVAFVKTNFYDKLASGTYVMHGDVTNYNTVSYIAKKCADRAAAGVGIENQANMAAWDIGMGLVAAAKCGVIGTELNAWIDGTENKINQLNSAISYDVIGLAGALYGLAYVHATFDPTAGSLAAASSIHDLANILASYQIISGGFAWNSAWVIPNDGDEAIQETAYAILALNEIDRAGYIDKILSAADYLASVQLGTGGWSDYQAPNPPSYIVENNEVTAEALWGYTVAYQPGTYPSVSMWGDPFKIVLDGKKSGSGVNGDATSQVLNIYPNPANDKVNISSDNNINHVWVLNNMGKIVIENSPNANQVSIDVSMLSPGLYIIKAETNGAVITNKVMIK